MSSDNKSAVAKALGEQTGATLCELIGHTVILYRAHPEEPCIKLPERSPEPT